LAANRKRCARRDVYLSASQTRPASVSQEIGENRNIRAELQPAIQNTSGF
jgi:hypothetical protein